MFIIRKFAKQLKYFPPYLEDNNGQSGQYFVTVSMPANRLN
jgi:hypothetical protein